MNILQIAALLIVLAGAFGTINALALRLPSAIGILIVALLASLVVMAVEALAPGLGIARAVRGLVGDIDFSDALLDGMLGLLLFAGALNVRFSDLRSEWRVVLLMATIGVGLSVAVIGAGFYWLSAMPLLVALSFGAVLSPTDPVAVLGVLRAARLPKGLETRIAGESLFNDGVGYVVFLVVSGLAFAADGKGHGGLRAAARLFLQEAGGGVALGLVLGWLVFRVMRRIDDYPLEVLLTLGLALGGYELAVALHVSGPLTAVSAGLLIGEVGNARGMSAETIRYVDAFWKLIDEILNAVLFLMIGFEVFAVAFSAATVTAGVMAIALALVARLVAVTVPILLLQPFRSFGPGVIPVMTWGGLKGGISVALALSLPAGEWTPIILTATYMVVLFSIVGQGLTVAPLARRVTQTEAGTPGMQER